MGVVDRFGVAKRTVGRCKAAHAAIELALESSVRVSDGVGLRYGLQADALRQQEWYRERRLRPSVSFIQRWKVY